VTRGSIPRFDLYEELEVSRLASVEVIEAAYRSLVKRHHPDVARPRDAERITRLNLAREWLRDPERRTRYDEATYPRTSTARAARARSASPAAANQRTGSRSRARPSAAGAPAGSASAASARRSTSTSFGINTPQVRQFLSDLRELDRPRARQVWDGRAVAHSRGYSAARRRALAASRDGRHSEWLFAREAASVIARGKLGDSTLTAQVLDVVADIAGVLTIRDLITRADFELLLLPWTWRGDRLPLTPTPPPAVKAKPRRAPAAFEPEPRREPTPVAAATQPSASPQPAAPSPAARPPVAPPSATPRSSAQPEPSPGAPPTWPSAAQWPIPTAPTPAPSTEPAALAREPIALADRLARLRASAPHRRILAPFVVMGRRAVANPAAAMPLLFVIVTVTAFGAAMLGVNRPQPATAGDVFTSPPASTQAVAGMTSDPEPTPAATSNPPIVAIDPAQLRALRQGAQRTLRSLAAAAATGDVTVARALLGESAPGLRASGLRKASFPDVAAADIAVVRSGDEWIATAGVDRLVSRDGSSWTFDYADRPLAIFTGASERDLFWLAPVGRRDLYLRVTSVKASRDGLSVRFAWEYGPGAASYLAGASIAISSVTLGTRPMPLTGAASVTIGTGPRVATRQVEGSVEIPSVILIQMTVSPRTTGNGGARPISTVFELGSS
jgi:DnaJ domain